MNDANSQMAGWINGRENRVSVSLRSSVGEFRFGPRRNPSSFLPQSFREVVPYPAPKPFGFGILVRIVKEVSEKVHLFRFLRVGYSRQPCNDF